MKDGGATGEAEAGEGAFAEADVGGCGGVGGDEEFA